MRTYIYALTIAAASCAAGCSSDKEPLGGGTADTGTVRLTVAASAEVASETRAETVELPAASVPDADDFSLRITGSYYDDAGTMHSYDRTWPTVGAFDAPKMVHGDYTASISFGDMQNEGTDAACFAGTQDFTILARRTVEAAITASLQNAAFRLAFGEWFSRYYTQAKITVRTESDHSFTFTQANTSLVFVKPATKLFLKGTAVKAQNGAEVEFPEAEIGTTKARTLHTIRVDASEAGGGKLVIDLDDTFTELEEQVIELNPEAQTDLRK